MKKKLFLDPISKKMFEGAGQHGPIALMYHSIHYRKDASKSPWSISYENFCRQLDLLSEYNWKTIRVKDLSEINSQQKKTVIITFDDGFKNNYKAFEAIMERGMCATWFVVTNDIGRYSSWNDHDAESQCLLNEMELKEFVSAGMEIASHTCSHNRMIELNDYELMTELTQSKKLLERLLNIEVKSFAYPYGLFNKRCRNAVCEAGYQYACSTRSGWVLAGNNNLSLRRITIFNTDNLSLFARKLTFQTNDAGIFTMINYYGQRVLMRIMRAG